MESVAGRGAFVTGAASGIGLAMARRFERTTEERPPSKESNASLGLEKYDRINASRIAST